MKRFVAMVSGGDDINFAGYGGFGPWNRCPNAETACERLLNLGLKGAGHRTTTFATRGGKRHSVERGE